MPVSVVLVVVLVAGCSVCGAIQIISSTSSPHLVEVGATLSLSCQTEEAWFLCVWTSPAQDRVCAIQEGAGGAEQVCHGDSRVTVQGEGTHCGIRVRNVTQEDWGSWLCLMQEGEEFTTDRRELEVEVGRRAEIGLGYNREGNTSDSEGNTSDSEGVLRVTEGETAEISCMARQGYPRPQFSWSGPSPASRRVRKYLEDWTREETGMGNITQSGEVRVVNIVTTLCQSIILVLKTQ